MTLTCRTGLFATVAWLLLALPHNIPAQGTRFGEVIVVAQASGDELSAQPDLWVMEVRFRPMRQVLIELTDPKTGQKRLQYVWYIAYRAINRKLSSRAIGEVPVNELDAPVIPPQFIPTFTLVTTDTDEPKAYEDQVIPEAVASINKRERSVLKNSVAVVTDVPAAAAPGSPDERIIHGVATWVNVDPEADRYTVYLGGFSNGFKKVAGPDGTEVLQTKTIRMKYWRPGDRFDQKESEIRLDGDPQWIYR